MVIVCQVIFRIFFLRFPGVFAFGFAILSMVIIHPSIAAAQNRAAAESKFLAWGIGRHLSKAAIQSYQGYSQSEIDSIMKDVHNWAEYLGTEVPPLPKITGIRANDFVKTADYLFETTWIKIGSKVQSKYNKDYGLIFEMTMKSYLLILIYSPGDDMSQTITEKIRDWAKLAHFPKFIWKPLHEKVKRNAPYTEIKIAFSQMHEDIRDLLLKNILLYDKE